MILADYSSFRAAFAVPAAPIASDGFEQFPVDNLRINDFNTIEAPANMEAFPVDITINDEAVDSGDYHMWYLSQRADGGPYFTLAHGDLTKTGTVTLDVVQANIETLLGIPPGDDWFLPENLDLIFKHCHLYVQRNSDKAYQWCNLEETT